MGVQEILQKHSKDRAVEALRSLFFVKWEKKFPDVQTGEFYDFEGFSQVERDFMIVHDFEDLCANNGRGQYAELLQPHLGSWYRVGMEKTASAFHALSSWRKLQNFCEQQIYTEVSKSDLSDSLRSKLLDLKEEIENSANDLLEFYDILPEYVRKNVDQFCRQDADGNFI